MVDIKQNPLEPVFDTELANIRATYPDPYLVTFNDLDSDNPKNWPEQRKWAVTNVLSVTGFNRILVSTVMAPALSVIAKDLDMTATQSVMALSIYLLATAFGPLVIGPLSEVYGRKTILHISNIWFLVWNVACGFANTKELLIGARFLAGFGASAVYALGGGVLGDIWRPDQRGKSLGWYMVIPLVGAAVGPIIGGFMTYRVTWRWMFWSTSLFQVAMAALSFTTFQETYAPAILKQRAQRLREETGEPYYTYEERTQEEMPLTKVLVQAMTRPLRLLAFHPIIQVAAVISALGYGLLYIVLSSFAELWAQHYGQSVEISGLHYIACALGELLASQLCAPLMDYWFHRMERRASGQHVPEHRIPLMLMFAFVAPVGFVVYGWCAEYRVHWAWVDVAMCITTFGMQIAGMPLQAYLMDSYPDHTSSAIAAQQFPRSLAAFLFPLFTPQMSFSSRHYPEPSPSATKTMASEQQLKTTPSNDQYDGMKIIHAGLFRTATKSMTEAYRILGYKAHHALDDVWAVPWSGIEQAAEATFPHLAQLPDYTYKSPDGSAAPRPPFTRDDWQSLWGEYDVATDIASAFVPELIKAYPDAKVVVVQRQYESWWPSFKSECLDTLYRVTALQQFVVRYVIRFRAGYAMKKIHAGFFGADEYSLESVELRARDVYEEYYRKVREAVPLESGRRLDYNIGDGWEPLCEFLGKDVPDVPFPRVNDRADHSARVKENHRKMTIDALKLISPIVAVLVGVTFYYWR
ncbi:hypothetical protein ACHAQC_011170 [Fusarium culmorum]